MEDASRQAEAIAARSRGRNAHDRLSGVLVLSGGHFVQVLEGHLPDIERVFERIQRDERHHDIRVLECAPVPQRHFADWPMAFGQPVVGSELARAVEFDPSLGGSAPSATTLIELLRGLIAGPAVLAEG
jgi:hypothetical protein